MANLIVPNYFTIGRGRSGAAVMIPFDLNNENVAEYFQTISVDDQVDTFCVLEFILLMRLKAGRVEGDFFAFDVAFKFLWKKSQESPMVDILAALQLHTSIDRMRFGAKLAK